MDTSGCWPDLNQELLLKAALWEGDRGIEAWHQWRRQLDFNRLDFSSRQIIPLLYRNLKRHSISDPLLEKFKGIYRQTWYRNQVLFRAAEGPLCRLREAGIPTMALKGGALIFLYYRDFGLRPLADLDVQVPVDKATEAARVLIDQGWMPAAGRRPDHFDRDYLSVRHSHSFTNDAGLELDLHWHPLMECCDGAAGADFWEAAVPLQVHNLFSRVPSPTDLLLQVCVHGAQWCQAAHLRWAADAIVIIGGAQGAVDWDRLLNLACKHRLIAHMEASLGYLARQLDAPVPESFLTELRSQPLSRIEKLEYRALTSPHGLRRSLVFHWSNYLRCPQTSRGGFLRKILGFPTHLCRRWDRDSIALLPVEISARLINVSRTRRARLR